MDYKIGKNGVIGWLSLLAVSYTHLDVYKRQALYSKAEELGCNKLALGHHYDDVIETTMLNLLCAGNFKTMLPKLDSTNFDGIQIIRPLYYIREEHICLLYTSEYYICIFWE